MTYLGKEGFAWRVRGRGNLYRLTINKLHPRQFLNIFPHTLRVPYTDCFKSIAPHEKMHISQELFFLWINLPCHET